MPGAYVLRTVHVFIQSHLKRHTASCRPVPRLRRAFQRTLIRLLPTVQGVMADLWPCLTASTLVILLCYQSNEAKITLQTTDCNYTFKSQSLERGRRLWLGMRRSQKVTRQTAFWYFSLKKHGSNVRKDANHIEEERLSSSEYHEDVTFMVMWLSNK